MAEENKHPPTTEEQAPPEMPGKAPEMEQAEIPDVGGAPAPSAKVIDLSAVRSAPEKDAPPDIPKEPEAPPISVTEYSKQEWKKPMPEPEKTKPKRGRPAKSEKAAPTEPGAKKEAQAEKPRRGRPSKAEKVAPEQTKRLSVYLNQWEEIDFEDRRQVADGLISQIRATDEHVSIEWKI